MELCYDKCNELLACFSIDIDYEDLLVNVDSINICLFPCGGGFDFHTHSNYEFHYIKSGRGDVILNRSHYKLNPGDFYITGPGLVHKQIADEKDPMVEYAMKCSIGQKKLDVIPKSIYKYHENSHLLDILNRKASGTVAEAFSMDSYFESIFHEVRLKRPGFYKMVKNLIIQIIIAAARNFTEETGVEYDIPSRKINSHRINAVKSYIEDNYNKKITCGELANHLFLSSRQLNRVVKRELGCTIHQYIMLQKIEIIKKLLKTSEYSLRELAEQTGFSSEFHLSSTFKKWMGISPAVYKNSG